MTWLEAARYCEDTYGTYVSYDPEDMWFECPECGEPLLICDWKDYDFTYCPVCEFNLVEGE